MKFNKWTLGLAAVGAVSFASAVQAAEQQNPVMTALSSTTISGYVDVSGTWRFGRNTGINGVGGTGWTTPGLFGQLGQAGTTAQGAGNTQNKADGFNLDVVKLAIAKPIEETSDWSAGYNAELLFGPDAIGYNSSVKAVANNEVGIKQAYVALRAPIGNGLTFKAGVFDAIIGYEGFDAVSNPHFSRSYGYALEPFEHTGVLATYKVADFLSICGGVADSAVSSINQRSVGQTQPAGAVSESQFTYMGALAITLPESMGFLSGSSIYGGIVNGLNNDTLGKTTWLYAGATLKTPIAGVTLGGAYDYRGTEENTSKANLTDTVAWTAAGYVSIQPSEKLKLNFRGDYGHGSNGTWYTAVVGPQDNEVLGATGTVQYDLWANVISRLELRWDRCLNNLRASEGPFGMGDNNNFYAAVNLIYRF